MKRENKKNTVNIRELARRCNISTSTVSRILNRPQEKAGAGRELYDRVRKVAEELGYRPNYLARAMFTHKTNLVGLISGYTPPFSFGPFIEGMASVLTPLGKGIFVYPCRNEPDNELEALDRMIYQKMDAIVYFPCIYPGGRNDSPVLAEKLRQYPSLPPVLAVMGDPALAQVHQIRIHDAEIGRRAALRQLELGCRRFGVLNTEVSSVRSYETIRSYRETLAANGVGQDRIAEAHVPIPPAGDDLAALKGIEGLWCSYLLVLPSCLHALEQVCEVPELQVDTYGSFETTSMFRSLLPAVYSEGACRTHPFKSLYLSLISLYDLGAKSADIIVRELRKPGGDAPRVEYLENTYCTFDERMNTRVFS